MKHILTIQLFNLSKHCLEQINQLREQRDRAEKEVKEEKDLHERELTDYKMKIHSLESEVEKLQVRLDKAYVEKVNNQFILSQFTLRDILYH